MTDLAALTAAVRRAATELALDALPDLVAALEGARAVAYVRMTRPTMPAPAIPTSPQPTLVDAAAMAQIASLRPSWIRDRARRGKIPVTYVGRYQRFRVDDVLKSLAENPPSRRRRRRKRAPNGAAAQESAFCDGKNAQ